MKNFMAGLPSEMKLRPPSVTMHTQARWNVLGIFAFYLLKDMFYSIHQRPFPLSFPSQCPPIPQERGKFRTELETSSIAETP